MTSDEFKAVFNLPFAEASSFFQQKLNIPTATWTDLWKGEHAKGFMSAGATKAGLLSDLHGEISKAIAGGLTRNEFLGKFDEIVAKHGWSYKGGRRWRSNLIYDTNVTTAYQAGRWKQFVESGTKYLRYVHADGVRYPRPLHVAWNGTTLPIDHDFWKTHYPPNGWRCHCRAVIADAHEMTPPPKDWDQLDPNTGAMKGIDAGWDYNVGQAMFKWQPDLDTHQFPIARDMVNELANSDVFQTWHDYTAQRVAAELVKPDFKGLTKEGTIKELRNRLSSDERFPIAVLPENVMTMIGANTQGVYLSLDDLVKQMVSRQGQNFEALDYLKAQVVIEEARLIVRDSGTVTIFVSDSIGWYAAVLKTAAAGKEVFLKSFRRSSEKNMLSLKKRGEILLET
jgi:hypothetical protein